MLAKVRKNKNKYFCFPYLLQMTRNEGKAKHILMILALYSGTHLFVK